MFLLVRSGARKLKSRSNRLERRENDLNRALDCHLIRSLAAFVVPAQTEHLLLPPYPSSTRLFTRSPTAFRHCTNRPINYKPPPNAIIVIFGQPPDRSTDQIVVKVHRNSIKVACYRNNCQPDRKRCASKRDDLYLLFYLWR